jgi:hypothetical protein
LPKQSLKIGKRIVALSVALHMSLAATGPSTINPKSDWEITQFVDHRCKRKALALVKLTGAEAHKPNPAFRTGHCNKLQRFISLHICFPSASV